MALFHSQMQCHMIKLLIKPLISQQMIDIKGVLSSVPTHGFPSNFAFVFFVCFVALRPKSTAMVIVGRSVHLTTLFSGQA